MDAVSRLNFRHGAQPWLRRFGLALAALALVWLLGWLWVPGWARQQIESTLTEQLGRRVSVGALEFKPWSLEIDIDHLTVAGTAPTGAAPADAGGVPPLLQIDHIYIDGSWQSLWRMAPVLDALRVSAPQLKLRHLGQGRFDLDDVLARWRAQPAAPDQAVARFAVANVQLSDGAITLQDQPSGRTHRLTGLQLSLPRLSSLASQRQQPIDAALSFAINQQPIDIRIGGTPLAADARWTAQLKTQALDLAPYLPYWPAQSPLALRAARLDADLALVFEPAKPDDLSLSGALTASAVRLAAAGPAAGSPDLLAFERLALQLKAVQPLRQDVQLGRIDWQGPRLNLQRDRQGRLNWLTVLQPKPARPVGAAKAQPAATAKAGAAGSSPAAAPDSAAPWRWHADELALQGGQVDWLDNASAQPARLRLDDVSLQLLNLDWPVRQPAALQAQARLDQAPLHLQGSVSDQQADLSVQLSNLPLTALAPYLAGYLRPALSGQLMADARLHWQAGGTGAERLRLELPSARLDRLLLAGADKKPLAQVARLELANLRVEPLSRSARLGSARLEQPQLRVSRSADGRWMAQDWLQPPPGAGQPPGQAMGKAQSQTQVSTRQPPWTLALDDLRVQAGSLAWRDASAGQPVVFDLDGLALQARNISTASGRPIGLRLDARMRHGHAESGRLSWRGSASLTPPGLRGTLNAERLPLHALAPYLSERLNVQVRRADASFKGSIRYAQPAAGTSLQLKGDARLQDLQAFTLAQAQPPLPAQELLDLKSLSLDGVSLQLQPGQATQLEVQATVLSDFYARITLNENGRFNLQDLLRPTPAAASGGALAQPQPTAAPAPPALIRLGPTSLQGGRVDFTDHFIQPNYATQLSGLAGRLGAFASENAAGALQLADLELRGRAEGSATLEIVGKINPLAQPLALDVQGRVRDLELSPLSTYAARYAGYGIERGKLSVDVAYKIDPDGMLTARNDIVLNQLKFGDAVEGAKNSLPVKLAVALLADRNGVIDINLPISGSIKDPQFRLMPIVFRLIGNLIMKAVTAPFSLLAHIFSAGQDSSSLIRFAPGSAVLDEPARVQLDKVVQVLRERPALKMTVAPGASLAIEREAFQRAQLQRLVQIEKRQRAPTASVAAGEAVAVSAQEYPELLRAVYRRAAFAKPRNWIGMIKDIPVADMEALLLANLPATESDMQMLAVQRGVAVRDYLAGQQLPMDRLFLGATQTQGLDAQWQPQAELSLSVD